MTEEIKSVGDIRVQLDDKSLLFDPLDDISGKEVALIMQMFLNAMFHRDKAVLDIGGFLNKHNLQKHFAEIKDEPKEGQEAA